MITLFGIPNCDTVKKARVWLDEHAINHDFHNFRQDGLSSAQIQQWIKAIGIEKLINKRSTSWKALTDEQKNSLNEDTAITLILESPTLIKRPLLDNNGEFHVGFKAADYEALFTE